MEVRTGQVPHKSLSLFPDHFPVDFLQGFSPVCFPPDPAFPYCYYFPSKLFQFSSIFLVPLPVPADLDFPELHIRGRDPEISAAFMPVPETTMDEYDSLVFREHDIRMPRKPFVILPVSKSFRKKVLPDNNFRFRVPAMDTRHVQASLFRCQGVHLSLPQKKSGCCSQATSGKSTAILSLVMEFRSAMT